MNKTSEFIAFFVFLLLTCFLEPIGWAENYQFLMKWTIGEPQSQARVTAVDSSGNVYVADSGNNRIQKFSSTGVFITKWGSSGTGDGQFSGPGGIAVDSVGNVYVADTGL